MTRQIKVSGDTAIVPLTKGFNSVIDASLVHLVEGFNWRALVGKNATYAARIEKQVDGSRKTILMHRVIAKAASDVYIDHVSGDGLDNRLVNLRAATRSQNQFNSRTRKDNTSGFKGVWWHKTACKWQAAIRYLGKRKSLGLFESPEDAHIAYCKASSELHGAYGRVS